MGDPRGGTGLERRRHGEDELLARCYRNSLALAVELGARSVAFPAISTGAYSFPLERATRIAVAEIAAFLDSHSPPDGPEGVAFVCFGANTKRAYDEALKALAGDGASGR